MPSFLNGSTAVTPARTGGLIGAVYTRLTGRPYVTVGGHASRDFGPTPGAVIASVFGAVPDDVLLVHGTPLYIEAQRIQRERHTAQTATAGGTR